MATNECAGCGKRGEEHRGRGQVRWKGCDFCDRWFVEGCTKDEGKGPLMRCEECRRVQRKVELMVGEWP